MIASEADVYSSQQRLSAAPVPGCRRAELRVAFPWQAYLAQEARKQRLKLLDNKTEEQ